MRIQCNIVLVMILVFSGTRSNAQYVEVLAKFDTNQVRIGEVFHLDLSVEQPVGLAVEFPVIRDTLADKVEVLGFSAPDTLVMEDDNLQISQRFRMICFDSGFYEIPPLVFEFSAGDWSDSISTYPLYLMVNTVAVDSTLYDIKSPIHMPVGFLEVFPFVLGGIALVLVVGLLFWYLRKRRKGESVFIPSVPEEPAHVIALRELNELNEQKLWQQNEFKDYYSRLTGIIRRYMERRYKIPAMEMTSYDILKAWKDSGKDRNGLTSSLDRLLNLADLVKFAKERPVATDNEENMERAYDFVHRTKVVKPIFGEDKEEGK